jgi:hypothetical protein
MVDIYLQSAPVEEEENKEGKLVDFTCGQNDKNILNR